MLLVFLDDWRGLYLSFMTSQHDYVHVCNALLQCCNTQHCRFHNPSPDPLTWELDEAAVVLYSAEWRATPSVLFTASWVHPLKSHLVPVQRKALAVAVNFTSPQTLDQDVSDSPGRRSWNFCRRRWNPTSNQQAFPAAKRNKKIKSYTTLILRSLSF